MDTWHLTYITIDKHVIPQSWSLLKHFIAGNLEKETSLKLLNFAKNKILQFKFCTLKPHQNTRAFDKVIGEEQNRQTSATTYIHDHSSMHFSGDSNAVCAMQCEGLAHL